MCIDKCIDKCTNIHLYRLPSEARLLTQVTPASPPPARIGFEWGSGAASTVLFAAGPADDIADEVAMYLDELHAGRMTLTDVAEFVAIAVDEGDFEQVCSCAHICTHASRIVSLCLHMCVCIHACAQAVRISLRMSIHMPLDICRRTFVIKEYGDEIVAGCPMPHWRPTIESLNRSSQQR